MPRYYFDIRDEQKTHGDDIGLECDSLDAVRNEAVRALHDMARELPHPDRREMAIEARDETGRRVLTATLSLRVER